jgi:hypothetical protein
LKDLQNEKIVVSFEHGLARFDIKSCTTFCGRRPVIRGYLLEHVVEGRMLSEESVLLQLPPP